ncbi:MAG TPA: hypothetical protein VIV01_25465 [Hyphomicrobiaceae bacterium]
MRLVVAGPALARVLSCVLALALSPNSAAAQDNWPWALYPSLRKQAAPPKRTQPRPPAKAEESKPAATAALDPQLSPPHPAPDARPQATDPASRPEAGAASPDKAPASWQWRILRTAWTERDEKGYEEFVARIGESGCRSMHACLTSAASNPLYRASNPPGMHFYADCADLPYMLRAYYAWKNGLPFSYSTAVTPLGFSKDIRYTARGNAITSRRDLTDAGLDARKAIPQVVDTISSAHYRTPPDHAGKLLPDHYPVRISRESIRPGTIIYDPNGHVAVVYKVTPEGRIHYIDTHPDNSLTRGIYGKAFSRATPAMGAGFKRWRPQTLVGAAQRPDGSFAGGHIVLSPDKDIPDWSDEQFFGTERNRTKAWTTGKFVLEGETLEYYDYVRRRLATAGFRYDPLEETRTMVRSLCEDLKYRVDAVDVAIKAGIHKRPQPDKLPNNIYGTDGDWETYSTPSRDARLKTAFKELRDEVARFLALSAEGSKRLDYAGEDLRSDIRATYLGEAAGCTISYTRSDGSEKQLTFAEVAKRLFALSFDPHHCVERRWGAQDAQELSTCADGADKRAWYDAQQRLRNQPDRTYDARMGFSLAELRKAVPGNGIDVAPAIDVLTLLGEAPAGQAAIKTYEPAGQSEKAAATR